MHTREQIDDSGLFSKSIQPASSILPSSIKLITLGIGNARLVKMIDIFVKVLCGATLIAGVIGIYLRTFAEAAA